jgi:hypothetical protein
MVFRITIRGSGDRPHLTAVIYATLIFANRSQLGSVLDS